MHDVLVASIRFLLVSQTRNLVVMCGTTFHYDPQSNPKKSCQIDPLKISVTIVTILAQVGMLTPGLQQQPPNWFSHIHSWPLHVTKESIVKWQLIIPGSGVKHLSHLLALLVQNNIFNMTLKAHLATSAAFLTIFYPSQSAFQSNDSFSKCTIFLPFSGPLHSWLFPSVWNTVSASLLYTCLFIIYSACSSPFSKMIPSDKPSLIPQIRLVSL